MSKENLDQFIQKVTDSDELQARIGEEIDIDSLIALGAEHGCEFSAEELTAGTELSDEELDGVAGGAFAIANAVFSGFRDSDTGKFRIACKVRPASGMYIDDASSN
jgi:predicted ribosomally synthesized peptide with nif11-like leader